VSDLGGGLYQEIGTGALFLIEDASERWVRLQSDDRPHERRTVPIESFVNQYAPANSV